MIIGKIVLALIIAISGAETAVVNNVIDGDTIDTSVGRVRLLGINTPERGERCYAEASEYLRQINNTEVKLTREIVNKDKYDRLLRHITFGRNINMKMVEDGFARMYCLFPNLAYCDELKEKQLEAINGEKGCLWKKSNNPCIHISEVNALGNWVSVKNICTAVQNTTGIYAESDGRSRTPLGDSLCSKCTKTVSVQMGKFAFIFDENGLIDFRQA
jgi:endonuclease YncB( thermonuclease family)